MTTVTLWTATSNEKASCRYYRHRHQVGNFFCCIKAYRRIATRYDKLAVTFPGFIQLAAILDWLSLRF